jgi:hypothetical protein
MADKVFATGGQGLNTAEVEADKEMMLAAVQFGEVALQYVSKNLKINRDFVFDACRTLTGEKIQDSNVTSLLHHLVITD